MEGSPDTYRTLAAPATYEVKIKGSRFIGEAFPASDEPSAVRHISAVRRREHGATHHCWAYRLGPEGAEFRYDDDGEPSGTAGLPILRHIDGRSLVDTLVVVTRYYGGTKLGTGGLMRAYGDVAEGALAAAKHVERVIHATFSIRFAYDDTAAAMQTLSRFDARIGDSSYGADVRIVTQIRRSQAEAFVTSFTDSLGGRGVISRI